jgi:hypothetical protein
MSLLTRGVHAGDINRPHSLSRHTNVDAVSKNKYPHLRMQISVLGYPHTVK